MLTIVSYAFLVRTYFGLQSAAVGTACAGQLYFCASFSIAVILTLLRFGPRQHIPDDDEDEPDYQQEFDNMHHEQQHSQRPPLSYQAVDANHPDNLTAEIDPEAQPLNTPQRASMTAASIASGEAKARKRRPNTASLGGIL